EAGKKLDDAIREQARKDAQKLMDDLNSKDSATKAAAEKKLDDLMKKAEEIAKDQKQPQPTKEQIDRMKDLAKDLNSPNKNQRANKELEKKLGWRQEDYDRFVKGFEDTLKRQDTAPAENKTPGAAPPVDQRNTGTAGKVETRPGTPTSSPQASGPAYAPPG